MTDTEALKPCPWCQSSAVGIAAYYGDDATIWNGECSKCGANGPWSKVSEDEARTLWNTRAGRAEPVGWMPMETAPRDGTFILAKCGDIADERWSHLSGRCFVIKWIGVGDWSLHPGFGVGDNWLAGWQPLPDTHAAPDADLVEALRRIADGDYPRERVTPYRKDGKPSKNDLCAHSTPIWQDCTDCAEDFARAALRARGIV